MIWMISSENSSKSKMFFFVEVVTLNEIQSRYFLLPSSRNEENVAMIWHIKKSLNLDFYMLRDAQKHAYMLVFLS